MNEFKLNYLYRLMLVAMCGVISENAFSSEHDNFTDTTFDESLILGEVSKLAFEKINNGAEVEPGKYLVDLYVNGTYYRQLSVSFDLDKSKRVVPCMPPKLLMDMGVDKALFSSADSGPGDSCKPVDQYVKGATAKTDFSELRVDLLIPQASMVRVARDSVAEDDLNEGETVGFINYDSNYYHSKLKNSDSTYSSTYVGLNSGVNLGMWRIRQQSSFTNTDSSTSASQSDWKSIRTYAQRPLVNIGSELTIGDAYTSGNQFGSIGIRGVQLNTDERMRPASQRGYAPTIRGIANTTAKVVVKQNGKEVYQTTVAPGAFIIDDLYPTSYEGDLLVEVQEADGARSSFTVPFSAVPESMRPGLSKARFSAGEVRSVTNSDAWLAEGVYEHGLSNAVTGSTGGRLSDDYFALYTGLVYSSVVGAIGSDVVYSNTKLFDERLDGWRFGINYSKTMPYTGTNFALAGYRYSTEGYRDLSDILGLRAAQENHSTWQSSTYQQDSQFVANIGQPLGSLGQIYLSGAISKYRDRGNDTQYQFGYSTSYAGISYNLSIARQKMSLPEYGQTIYGGVGESQQADMTSTQNIAMLSVSMPLGNNATSPVLSISSSRNSTDDTSSYQASLTGTLGEEDDVSYGVNTSYDTAGNTKTAGVSLNKQTSVAALGGSYSYSDDYSQVGASIRGAGVIHEGGVTLAPYLSDTFALVEADGAQGALVTNGMGASIDSNGYAVVPSLVPYRYNDIALDSNSLISNTTELAENRSTVAPYAGAAVKVKFNTVTGYPVLIKLDHSVPMGADVFDSSNTIVGMVGQGSQIYARVGDKKGVLNVKWGDGEQDVCVANYDLTDLDLAQSMVKLTLPCNK
ncbi:fimbria/pilus outer membrane usher protein [Aeromonas sp. CA23]|uniref:fimbria/pilus outer membrane usher protein n=1 Tax=Aeromonas sp. CA23 TaxID=2033032 RepID=UPI0012FD17B6|nr:fimbria/pilus outer membrane usher protein [Aeromonas sp. CA23]